MLKLLVSALSLCGVSSYSSGATDCNLPNHGTFKSPIPTDWSLSLLDSTGTSVTQWSAGQTYTAQIKGTTTSFKGWTWGALKGTPASFPAGSANKAGTFAAGDSYSHVISGCPGVLTQTNANTRTLIKATWTPPAAGTGTVSLWAMMIISKNGNNYNAVLSVPELGSAAASPSALAVSTTATATGSKGASATTTPTETVTASLGLTPSPKISHVAVAPVVAAVTTSSSMSAVAIGVGGGLAGLIIVGATVIGIIMVVRQSSSRPIRSVPTVFKVSPLSGLANQGLA